MFIVLPQANPSVLAKELASVAVSHRPAHQRRGRGMAGSQHWSFDAVDGEKSNLLLLVIFLCSKSNRLLPTRWRL
jgi:hypothetical protein